MGNLFQGIAHAISGAAEGFVTGGVPGAIAGGGKAIIGDVSRASNSKGSNPAGGVPSDAIQNAFGTPNNTYSRNPAWVNTAAQNVWQNAADAGNTPYKAYDGQQVAPLSSNQILAGVNAQNAVGRYAPTYGAITDYYNQSAQPNTASYAPGSVGYNSVGTQGWNADSANQYMNPYLQASLQPQINDINQQYALQQNQANARAAGSGNFGGSRQGVENALINQRQNQDIQNVTAQGYNNAYNTGLGAFQTDQARNLQGQLANQQAGINTGEFNQTQNANAFTTNQNIAQQNRLAQQAAAAGLTALTGQQQANANSISNNLMTTGAAQQQTQQAQDAAKYQDYLNKMYYPEQQINFMSGILKGNPAAGSISTGYNPGNSGVSNLASGVSQGISSLGGLSGIGSSISNYFNPGLSQLQSNVDVNAAQAGGYAAD